jgi:hypothetical protein
MQMQTPTVIMKSNSDPTIYNLPGFINSGLQAEKTDSLKHISSLGGQYGFFNHVFDTSESSKAEILNICQYALLCVVPVVLLNKFMAKMIPDPDPDASTIELVTEIVMQTVIVLIGMIIIHRAVTYVPTWSQFRYEPFILTNSILVFLIIVMSLNTKLGLKCSMLYDRALDVMGWGSTKNEDDDAPKNGKRYSATGASSHHISQSDNSSVGGQPVQIQTNTSNRSQTIADMFGSSSTTPAAPSGLQSANSLLGSAFN